MHLYWFNSTYDDIVEVEYIEDDGEKYYPLTQEERDDLERYVLSCDTLGGQYDDDILNICLEEAQTFFSGEASAEQAADMIQNRCSILVSERA